MTLTRERALREASQAEAELAAGYDRGPLHGIPYGAKDLLAARGYPTSWGAAPFKRAALRRRRARRGAAARRRRGAGRQAGDGRAGRRHGLQAAQRRVQRPGQDALEPGRLVGRLVERLRLGGRRRAVGFAIGSETWGSIVTPAAFCGVSGLRPTYGRVSRHGAMALSWTMDKLGPMARTADDCGLVLDAIAGHDAGDPTSSERPTPTGPRRSARAASASACSKAN